MHRACNGGCVLASGEVQGTKLPSRGTRLKGEDSRVAELAAQRNATKERLFVFSSDMALVFSTSLPASKC